MCFAGATTIVCLGADNIESHTAGMLSDTGHVLYQNDCCNELYTIV
jgi:hypothetical protein